MSEIRTFKIKNKNWPIFLVFGEHSTTARSRSFMTNQTTPSSTPILYCVLSGMSQITTQHVASMTLRLLPLSVKFFFCDVVPSRDVCHSPCHGTQITSPWYSLVTAVQSIDRMYRWQIWECYENFCNSVLIENVCNDYYTRASVHQEITLVCTCPLRMCLYVTMTLVDIYMSNNFYLISLRRLIFIRHIYVV